MVEDEVVLLVGVHHLLVAVAAHDVVYLVLDLDVWHAFVSTELLGLVSSLVLAFDMHYVVYNLHVLRCLVLVLVCFGIEWLLSIVVGLLAVYGGDVGPIGLCTRVLVRVVVRLVRFHVDLVVQVLCLGPILQTKHRVRPCALQHVSLRAQVCAVVCVLDDVEIAAAHDWHCVIEVVAARLRLLHVRADLVVVLR